MTSMLHIAVALALALQAPDVPQIRWETSFEAAQERATREGKVIFLAINMDDEPANDWSANDLYKDPEFVRLTERTVNLAASRSEHRGGMTDCARLGGIPCYVHRKIDKTMREEGIVKATKQGWVISPQHVWLDPTGQVILSVPYVLTKAEITWCFLTAMKTVDPEGVEAIPPELEPPARLVMGGVFDPARDPDVAAKGSRSPTARAGAAKKPSGPQPLSRAELVETIARLRASLDPAEAVEAMPRILVTDEKEAIAFVAERLAGDGARRRNRRPEIRLIRQVGLRSPESYWRALAPSLRDENEEVRAEAAVALEQIAAPSSRPAIEKCLAREKILSVRKNLLRALGRTGADDNGARDTLVKYASSAKDDVLRVNALVALGSLEPHAEIREALEAALDRDESSERIAAACAVAISRDPELEAVLEHAAKSEKDETIADPLRKAAAAYRSGNLVPLEETIRDIAQDPIPRPRVLRGD